MKFEELAELSLKRSGVGLETPISGSGVYRNWLAELSQERSDVWIVRLSENETQASETK